mgnify:FL=1|jgi:hypothetical protein
MKSILKIIKETKDKTSFSTKWANAKYLFLKQASTTETGTYGETLIVDLLKELGYDAEIVNNGKGDFDTLLNNLIKLENKTATMDVNGSFQFNAIKKGNIDYDFVFCLGVAYNKMYFEIVSKQFAETLTTQMTTHGGGYKYTSRPKRMKLLTYKNLKKEVSKIV